MASEGPNSPVTMASAADAAAAQAWSNVNNAKSSDNFYATALLDEESGYYSQYLKATNFAFTSAIDDNATIDGILVEVERYQAADSGIKDYSMQLINSAGTMIGADKATTTQWLGSDPNTYVSYGGSTDTWGITGLTGADVKDSDFGVVLAIQYASGAGTVTAYVDHVRMTVYYTNPSGLTTGQTAAPLISKRCGFVGAKYERGG